VFRILVVDDEPAIREQLEEALQESGYATRGAGDGKEAAELALKQSFDLCLSDIRMPSMSGIELLQRLSETSPETMVMLMTAHGELDTSIEALRRGAVDYLLKPFKHQELIARVRRLEEHRRLVLENRNLRRTVDAGAPRGMIGSSPAMARVLATVDRVTSLPSHVLITGESGTGKDLVARALHERGSRAKHPFVPINCAAIPEALLESELFGHVKGAAQFCSVGANPPAGHDSLARRRLDETGQHAYGRRLAGSVRTEKAEDRGDRNGEREILDGDATIEPPRQAKGFDRIHLGSVRLSMRVVAGRYWTPEARRCYAG
jgi:CheY-like chemotaxis protein